MTTPRRTQAERRDAMREQLMQAAKDLFVTKGFADTGTPEIVAKAGVTRGALYHHFSGKTDLFRAVCAAEAMAVGAEIDAATSGEADPAQALNKGAIAYFDAMSRPGRSRLLLLDLPAVMQSGDWSADWKDRAGSQGLAELRAGLAAALPDSDPAEVEAMADALSAAFDGTALAIAQGGDRDIRIRAMLRVLDRVTSAP